jgi:basic membrane protein A
MRREVSIRSKARVRFCAAAAVGCVLMALAAGCGSSQNSGGGSSSNSNAAGAGSSGSTSASTGASSGGSSNTGHGKLAATMVGAKNDQSINQAAYEGIQEAAKALPGVKLTAVLDSQATTQQQTNALQTLSPINNYVYVHSDAFSPILDIDASRFPQTKYIGMEAFTRRFHPNVYAAAVDWGASSYVAGVIAGHQTKSNVVGFIGGGEIPPTVQSKIAFIDGAKSVNPKVKVLTNITGSFADVTLAKQATAAMIQQGADVIMPWLDAAVVGAYEAGKESGKDPEMFKLTIPTCGAYDNIIGTELVNEAEITKAMIMAVVNGTAKPGATFIGLQDPKQQTLALCPKYQANQSVAGLTKQTIDNINSGKIKLPSDTLNPRPSYHYSNGLGG